MSGLVRLNLTGDYPSLLRFDENGSLQSAKWQNNREEEHRDNGFPSHVSYEKQRVRGQYWCVHGDPYRDNDLPHTISYYENGQAFWEFWGNDYNLDRVTGPVSIYYDENGNVTDESYVLKKDYVSKEEWLKDARVKRILKNRASGLVISDVSL